MIKATELRIGNLINHHVKNYDAGEIDIDVSQVLALLKDSINVGHGWTSIERLSPIPLTEDWLIKFGFNKPENLDEIDFNLTKQVGYRYKNDLGEIEYFYVISSEVDDYSCYYYVTKKVEFVHQLQNLYFALTGQELTIDPSRKLER